MKKIVLAAAAVAAMAIAAPAFAESNVSVGYTSISDSGYNLGIINGRYGWTSGAFGVEGEVGIGAKSDSGVKLSSEFGVFGTAQVNAADNFVLFARAGYAQATAKGLGSSDSESGFAYGAGAQWFFDMNNGVRLEYTNYDLGSSSSTYGISYVRKFK